MRVTVVGCGTAAPDGERVCSGFFVESGEIRLLLDCGPGVVHNMARFGLPWQRVTHVALSHFHNDHIGDVPMLLFALAHGVRPPREAPLAVLGPAGTRERLGRLEHALGGHVSDPGFPLEVAELGDGDVHDLGGGVRLVAGRTRHTENSLAFRVEHGGAVLGYTGDTGPSDDVAAFLHGVDSAICECALPEDEAMETHLTPSQLAAMARSMLPRRLIVTHVYPQLPVSSVPAQLQAAGWTGEVLMAYDGLRFNVPG
jgi:ribonuclease BN (tRNA processing enzyme)